MLCTHWVPFLSFSFAVFLLFFFFSGVFCRTGFWEHQSISFATPLFNAHTYFSSQFKSQPCKSVSIHGWTLLRSTDSTKQDSFQLNDPHTNTAYRFHCDSKEIAHRWMVILEAATHDYPPVIPSLVVDFVKC